MEIPSLPGVSSSRSRELRGQPALDAIARDTLDGLSASTLSDVLQLAQVTRTREPELAAAACRLLECWRKTGALTVPAGTGPTEWMSTAAWCQGTEILLTPAEADLAALRATADLGVRSPSSTDQEDGARARAQLLRLQPEMATPEVLKGQLQPILKSSNQSSEAQALTVSTVAAHYGWDRALQSVLGAARSNVSVPFMPLVDALD
ncbi:hypothetical protein DYH09_33635, partial [bacterium CPR1]|nr:hypothetical protein [bacterium CPR1]